MVTDELASLVDSALVRAAADGAIALDEHPPIAFERPRRREHGDWATNVALVVSRGGTRPRAVAEAIVDRLPASDVVARVEVAGPGFLNFHLAPAWLHDVVRRAADPGSAFGASDAGSGRRVNVEFVSANPTGPANVVSGRHAAIGDAIANLLGATGFAVVREYYVNDTGRQIELFARSIAARYLELFGAPAEVPPEGYQGDYIVDLARAVAAEVGDGLVQADEAHRIAICRTRGLEETLSRTRASLERFGTRYDVWTSEASLHASGRVEAAIEQLRAGGWVQERDGALWFLASRLGDDKDRVIVRAEGTPTYLAADVAYMLDKFARGFDRLVYVLGPDHHGTLPRLRAIADALGFGRDRVELRIVQNINIMRGGEAIKSSKRGGVFVTLDELVDEVGRDAARYTFLTRSIDAPLDFDIELAKEQAPENPVYYTQYAHARICSITRRAAEQGLSSSAEGASLDRLGHPSEDAVMRRIAAYEEVVPEAASQRAPQKLTRYVEALASDFSAFYRDCRVVSEDVELSRARLALCLATKNVLQRGLALLGVGAPERM
ncbi:MAG TPA: arginine--tRNA ligase [Actinomycetota bacterium]|nr:arginine--tRNA ligase [Actinomycetota bacterium]